MGVIQNKLAKWKCCYVFHFFFFPMKFRFILTHIKFKEKNQLRAWSSSPNFFESRTVWLGLDIVTVNVIDFCIHLEQLYGWKFMQQIIRFGNDSVVKISFTPNCLQIPNDRFCNERLQLFLISSIVVTNHWCWFCHLYMVF